MSDKGRVVIIGSGAAGTACSRSLATNGWDVTVVDNGKIGGTCLWHGCLPKKALFNAAHARRLEIRADEFGLPPYDGSFDWQSVLAWKWHAQETYAGDQEAGFADRGIRLVKARASFKDESTILAGDEALPFDHAVIATGSTPVMPPIDGIELGDTSADALGYHAVPERLLIVGGGFIGLEFAGIFASFGSRVTVVTSGPRPLEMADEDAAAVCVRHLLRLGVEFHTGCRMEGLSGTEGAIQARFTDADGALHEGAYSRVLVATGRRPAVAELDLDAADVEVDPHARVVHDAYLRTSNPNVWVAGDAAGGMMQTPVASLEGRTVAVSIDSGVPIAPDCSAIPTTVFTVPPIAQVGLTEAQARDQGIAYRISQMPFQFSGAAIVEDERDGLVKYLFAEDDDRLLGAHIAGPTAADLIYGPAMALRMGATSADLRAVLGIHPAYSELLNWAAG